MNIKKYVFKEIKNLTKQKFNENSNIYEIGIDSLDLIEIIIESEKKLGISIADEKLANLKTIKDIIFLLEKEILLKAS